MLKKVDKGLSTFRYFTVEVSGLLNAKSERLLPLIVDESHHMFGALFTARSSESGDLEVSRLFRM